MVVAVVPNCVSPSQEPGLVNDGVINPKLPSDIRKDVRSIGIVVGSSDSEANLL